MARDWPAEGGQHLTSADPWRQNSMIHTERVSKEVKEMEECKEGVERDREVGKRNL